MGGPDVTGIFEGQVSVTRALSLMLARLNLKRCRTRFEEAD
jgi:hypothetical protein